MTSSNVKYETTAFEDCKLNKESTGYFHLRSWTKRIFGISASIQMKSKRDSSPQNGKYIFFLWAVVLFIHLDAFENISQRDVGTIFCLPSASCITVQKEMCTSSWIRGLWQHPPQLSCKLVMSRCVLPSAQWHGWQGVVQQEENSSCVKLLITRFVDCLE